MARSGSQVGSFWLALVLPLALFGEPWGALGLSLAPVGLPWGPLWLLLGNHRQLDVLFRAKVAQVRCLRIKIDRPEFSAGSAGFPGNGVKPGRSGPRFNTRRGQGLREFKTNSLKIYFIAWPWPTHSPRPIWARARPWPQRKMLGHGPLGPAPAFFLGPGPGPGPKLGNGSAKARQ